MNIKQELENAIKILKENNIQEPILKARLLLADVLNKSKEYILVHDNKELENSDINSYRKNIEKLTRGTPLQYITNRQEFMGLEFYVDENVLIPQPDTEILVEEIVNIYRRRRFC